MLILSTFLFFWRLKRIAFKSSLDQHFHPLIVESFDLPSYGSELSKKIQTNAVVDVYRGKLWMFSAWWDK